MSERVAIVPGSAFVDEIQPGLFSLCAVRASDHHCLYHQGPVYDRSYFFADEVRPLLMEIEQTEMLNQGDWIDHGPVFVEEV